MTNHNQPTPPPQESQQTSGLDRRKRNATSAFMASSASCASESSLALTRIGWQVMSKSRIRKGFEKPSFKLKLLRTILPSGCLPGTILLFRNRLVETLSGASMWQPGIDKLLSQVGCISLQKALATGYMISLGHQMNADSYYNKINICEHTCTQDLKPPSDSFRNCLISCFWQKCKSLPKTLRSQHFCIPNMQI